MERHPGTVPPGYDIYRHSSGTDDQDDGTPDEQRCDAERFRPVADVGGCGRQARGPAEDVADDDGDGERCGGEEGHAVVAHGQDGSQQQTRDDEPDEGHTQIRRLLHLARQVEQVDQGDAQQSHRGDGAPDGSIGATARAQGDGFDGG